MFTAPRTFFGQSFQRKLLLFVLSAVVITTVLQFLYLINNFRTITDFALQQNTAGMERTVEEFLANYAQEKAASSGLQIRAAHDNLSALGRTAQQLVDSGVLTGAAAGLPDLAILQTPLEPRNGALTSPADATYDTFIPPPLVDDPRARSILESSALLNLSMQATFASNQNNKFIYFVGDEADPVTRAYPNIDLATALGDSASLHFWDDFFPGTVAGWTRYFRDPALRAQVGDDPLTIVGPYDDAAGQGIVLTMFYPLWDAREDRFAGAVGADIKLDSVIENILSFKVARSGFAFLMNGKGEVVAMPETGFQLFGIDLQAVEQGSLTFYHGDLASSSRPAVQQMAAAIRANQEGLLKIDLAGEGEAPRRELISYASLDPVSDSDYAADRWKIVIAVPEAEVFEVLTSTDSAVNAERSRISLLSLVIVLGSLLLVALISVRFSRASTRDLRALAGAAEGISAKRYDVDLSLKSRDEIGQLGRAFTAMSREIRDYTVNLEAKVAARTADLKRASDEISRLNDQLRGENLRLGAELDVARRLQMMVLPPELETNAVRDLDIGCFMRPADEVGGDYYDVLQVGDAVYMGIGDVTGHGLPAGIIMLMAQTAFLTLAQSGERDMERIMNVLNSVLYHNIVRIQEDKNMTLAVLQYRQHEIVIVGQHESVLVCRTGGEIEVIDTADLGLPLGLEQEINEFVALQRLRLNPGDVMLLYTDGVTEAENGARQQFGIPSLVKSLRDSHTLPAGEIVDRVMADLYAFIGETQIYDDISLLVVKQR
ncbi:SpoIIE family protein phosphatase [Oscillochloris sp. ZM17-4]|uniref:SpoIIE family protein phosphatase n=1 Tax=Oscillochloris sp. ZM17-4 TaxID=2866714 RepID=UPI001C72FE1E|nr:SpoIIE family protein phosphatase [Oscillochloris sp. ZM17-4]MBX0328754.1 SpoIIE family protein phosphatase [Oscillochloris sp. ZM17-4]